MRLCKLMIVTLCLSIALPAFAQKPPSAGSGVYLCADHSKRTDATQPLDSGQSADTGGDMVALLCLSLPFTLVPLAGLVSLAKGNRKGKKGRSRGIKSIKARTFSRMTRGVLASTGNPQHR